jgi:ATP-binding cassette, subfamily B, tetracycline resistant protein
LEMHGRTTIVISHRPSLIESADWLIVIENGQVVKAGPPGQLVASGKTPFEFVPRAQYDPRESVRSLSSVVHQSNKEE